MNKILFACFISASLLSFTNTPSRIQKKTILEAKGGYFFFQNTTLRKIYDHGGMDFQFSSSFPFLRYQKFAINGYASLEFLLAKGKSIGAKEKTTFMAIPISLGIKPAFILSSFAEYYLAFGPRYFYVCQRNHSSFVDRTNHDHIFGGFANTGFNFFPYSKLVLDVFGEYSYGVGNFSPRKTNVFGKKSDVGGFTFGLGLGWFF